MSKRNRHKKKKKLRQQKKISRFVPAAGLAIEATPAAIEETPTVEKTAKTPIEDESIIDSPTKKLIAKDVRLIAITLFGLVIILIAVKILQTKTGIINNFGDWLYKISNIQTM